VGRLGLSEDNLSELLQRSFPDLPTAFPAWHEEGETRQEENEQEQTTTQSQGCREEICVMENGAEAMDGCDMEHVETCFDDLRVGYHSCLCWRATATT
jgi:hypothetical protein